MANDAKPVTMALGFVEPQQYIDYLAEVRQKLD